MLLASIWIMWPDLFGIWVHYTTSEKIFFDNLSFANLGGSKISALKDDHNLMFKAAVLPTSFSDITKIKPVVLNHFLTQRGIENPVKNLR